MTQDEILTEILNRQNVIDELHTEINYYCDENKKIKNQDKHFTESIESYRN